MPKTLVFIAGGIFIALIFSVYWRVNHISDFLGNSTAITPDFNINNGTSGMEEMIRQIQGQPDDGAVAYKTYTTNDGYLSFKYPSSFNDGKNVMEKVAGTSLDSTNFLLYAYKIDNSLSEMLPTTLIAARYNATSTEDVVAQIKNALNLQQCQSDIKEVTTTKNTPYRLFESTYKCGEQKDLSLWQAKTAVTKKNDTEFYTVTGAAVSKKWQAAILEINSILDSISTNQSDQAAPEKDPEMETDNQSQNNETPN